MTRLHALDRVTVFVHVEEATSHCEGIKRICAHFPLGVKRLRVQGVANRTEALPATHVMHPVHRGPRLKTRHTDHRVARHDFSELALWPTDRFLRLGWQHHVT